jgi:REP element-mobilizing transposase RayT
VREQRHRVFAATIQASHVHLVFAPLNEDIKTVVARFKYRSAAAVLGRRRGLRPAETAGLYSRAVPARFPHIPKSLWTAGKFPVFIFNDLHVVNSIEYVRDHNLRIGLPPDPFDCIDPLFPASEMAGERLYRGSLGEEPRW